MEKNRIRYGQCWEDSDILLDALAVESHHTCLAIASAGDNALALLARSPKQVIALDYNPAQIACLELRVAAYSALNDEELLRFSGARNAWDRHVLYRLCRPHLSPAAREFWDERPKTIGAGYLNAGRFEAYLQTFREYLLPRIHSAETIASVFVPKSREERERFYNRVWDTHAWRLGFTVFFSRRVMQRLGRDPQFFRFAQSDLINHLQDRVRHAFVDLDPSANPYLRWMLMGEYGSVMPFALRSENIAAIRGNLERLSWKTCTLDAYLESAESPIDRFALSDVFEYVDRAVYGNMLQRVVGCSAPQARLTYWNMLVPRTRPERLANVLAPDLERAATLHDADKTFFYSRLIVEDVC